MSAQQQADAPPSLLRIPRGAVVDQGELLSDVAEAFGLTLDPWQRTVAHAAMGERADGTWSARYVGVSVRRQAGKNELLVARELAGLLALPEKTLIHSAHEFKTAIEHFRRLRDYFENYDDLRRRVRRITTSMARESIELTDGTAIRFHARGHNTSRGFSVDFLGLDEAQELSDDTWGVIQPTISARPNPQVWLMGTPPSPRNDGAAFTRFRKQALDDDPQVRTAWIEWSAKQGDNLDDPQTWTRAIPNLGNRISVETVADERANLDDESFARECLGQWSTVSTAGAVIDAATWQLAADPLSVAVSDFALGIDIDPERQWASVALAGKRSDGRAHIELDELRDGAGWVLPYVSALIEANPQIRAVVIDNRSAAATLIDELARQKIRVTTTGVGEMTRACGVFYDAVTEGWLVHTGQPQMSIAVSLATRRALGGAWAWSRRTSTSNITPLVAATLALHGSTTSKPRRPSRRRPDGRRSGRVLVPD